MNKRYIWLFLSFIQSSIVFASDQQIGLLDKVTVSSASVLKYTKDWISSHPIEVVTTAVVVGGITYGAFNYHRNQRTAYPLATILNKPATALSDLYRIMHQVQSEAVPLGLADYTQPDEQALMKFSALMEAYQKKSPIFLLGECTKQNFLACPLSRTYQPTYREKFETSVVDKFLEKAESSSSALQYVGFGCGGMFQDLVIACKMLTQKPNSSLAFHFIDPKFFSVVESRNIRKLDHAIRDEIGIDLAGDMQDLINHVREHARDKATKEASDDQIKKMIQLRYVEKEKAAQQFLSFLKKSFPDAALSLHLHSSADNYLEYIKGYSIPYPDIISAADIDDEMSVFQQSVSQYFRLCIAVLQNKPDTSNILLAKKDMLKAQLISISLNEVSGAEKEVIKYDDSHEIDVFTSADEILV